MTSFQQIQANRRNAQLSTGPVVAAATAGIATAAVAAASAAARAINVRITGVLRWWLAGRRAGGGGASAGRARRAQDGEPP